MASEADTPRPPRSSGISYQELLDKDSRPVPEVLRLESERELPARVVSLERYTSRAWHDLEVEHVWKKVWQMACREEEISEPGDHVVYDIASSSVLVVRTDEGQIKAFHNACLHRGRQLREHSGQVPRFRCPFHGWCWNLDGSLHEIPARWDFPHVDRDTHHLPEVQVGTWGGFVFVNLDPGAGSLEDYLGELPEHFERWPLEDRYKEAHVAKVLDCNWKVVQEAFMEAYHVVATHPQLLPGIGDANSQYDVWDHFSRAITPNMTPSPHLAEESSEQEMLDSMTGRSFDEDPMLRVADGMTARKTLAQVSRMQLQSVVPGALDLSDAELADSFYYTVFPNFHPWGAYNRIVYRFRPYRNDPDRSIMEVLYLSPFRGKRPPPAAVHWLAEDEDWTFAPELGFLARVFNQDTFNLAKVQRGLHASVRTEIPFARYQESKIRHFHALLDRHLGK